MPEWLSGILGTGADVVKARYQSQADIAYAQAMGSTIAQQRDYMAQMQAANAVGQTQSNRMALSIGAGILVLALVLRQTAQAR